MNKLINFYRSCIIYNLITSIYIFSIGTAELASQYIGNALTIFVMINFMKIFNQSMIIKYLIRNISNVYKKLLMFDTISDFLKFIVCNYLILNQNKMCTKLSLCVLLVVIYVNYIAIMCHSVYKCCSTITTRHEVETRDVEQVPNIEIYVPIDPHYDVTNYTVEKINNITCSICIEEQKLNENWTKLYCGHDFHRKCIKDWLSVKNICPVCRHSINNINNVNN